MHVVTYFKRLTADRILFIPSNIWRVQLEQKDIPRQKVIHPHLLTTILYSFMTMIPAVSEEVRCQGTGSDSCQQSLASHDDQNSADNLEAAGKIFELLML